jgi:hypothetical protein
MCSWTLFPDSYKYAYEFKSILGQTIKKVRSEGMHYKKGESDFPSPSRDVTNQTFLGREHPNGAAWEVICVTGLMTRHAMCDFHYVGIFCTFRNIEAPDRGKSGLVRQSRRHKPSTTYKIRPGSPSSSQPGGPPCWSSPLAFGLIGQHLTGAHRRWNAICIIRGTCYRRKICKAPV